jgi:hypothetical protein
MLRDNNVPTLPDAQCTNVPASHGSSLLPCAQLQLLRHFEEPTDVTARPLPSVRFDRRLAYVRNMKIYRKHHGDSEMACACSTREVVTDLVQLGDWEVVRGSKKTHVPSCRMRNGESITSQESTTI